MTRGPKPQSELQKFLKGNPRARLEALERLTNPNAPAAPAPVPHQAEPPPFLSEPGEIAIFRGVIASMPASIAKSSDVNAIARYAFWLHRWSKLKAAMASAPDTYETG